MIDFMRYCLHFIPWWLRLPLAMIGFIFIWKNIARWIYELRHTYIRDDTGKWKKKYWFGVERKSLTDALNKQDEA